MATIPTPSGNERRGLLREEASDLSEMTIPLDPPSPILEAYDPPSFDHEAASSNNYPRESDGLGISGTTFPTVFRRVPVGSRHHSSRSLSNNIAAGESFGSSTSDGAPKTPGSTASHGNEDYSQHRYGQLDDGALKNPFQTPQITEHHRSVSFQDTPDTSMTLTPGMDQNGPPVINCTSKHDIFSHGGSQLSIVILTLSVYSTIMSGIWFIAALIQPRWGYRIHSNGALTPSTASLLSALFAKTIELSFVTVFVAFIGQVLSRRSIARTSRGVTLAEMAMRTWIIQPGALLTHGQPLRYAGWTLLGLISLTASIAAMLYTTASDALVSPKLKFGGWDHVVMQGLVKQSYGNAANIKKNCATPIPVTEDIVNGNDYSGESCVSMEHAGSAYHNYYQWIATWSSISANGTGASSNIVERPQGVAILNDNTTVTGNWIMASNLTENDLKFKRIVNNVTMAMPHAGIIAAAKDHKNGIMQPGELQGSGEYHIRAGVPSPSVNVMCVDATAAELAPLLYVNWPNANTTADNVTGQIRPSSMNWEKELMAFAKPTASAWWNATVLDSIFDWGEKFLRKPPIFPMLPIDYNTLTDSGWATQWTGDSVHLLTKSSDKANYTICSMRSLLAANCSTHYNVTGASTGFLAAYCEDPKDTNTYIHSQPLAVERYDKNWPDIVRQWALALSLNDGVLNANSSNARLLSQFSLKRPDWGPLVLSALRPTLAEALAVLAGSTLLVASAGSPFLHYWDYPKTVLDPGQYQSFNATIESQEYTSGFVQNYQAGFYIVLFLVFATNVFCLAYFIIRRGLVTDFTEPQNLFAIAVNSPPSAALAGSCGAGPEGKDLGVGWGVEMHPETGHFSIEQRLKRETGAPGAYETDTRYRGQVGDDGRVGVNNGRNRLGGGWNVWPKGHHRISHSSSYEMLSGKRKSWL